MFLYYSGHGGQIDGDGGKCSEGMVSHDVRLYFDRELQTDLERLATKAAQVIFMNDSCFSGGAASKNAGSTDGGVAKNYTGTIKSGSSGNEGYVCGDAVNKMTRNLSVRASQTGTQLLYIAASSEREVSYASPRGSVATVAWAQCLEAAQTDTNRDGLLSGEELRQCAQQRVSSGGRMRQTITITGNSQMPVGFVAATAPAGAPQAAPVQPVQTLDGIRAAADPGMALNLSLSQQRLSISKGDKLDFTVSTPQAGYMYLLHIGSDGKTFDVLFPNDVDNNNYVAAGTRRFPRPNWAVQATGPEGTGHVMAYLSNTPKNFRASMGKLGPFASAPANVDSAAKLGVVAVGGGALQAQVPPPEGGVVSPSESAKPSTAKLDAAKDVVLDRSPPNAMVMPATEPATRPAEANNLLPVLRSEALLAQRLSALSGNLAELGLSMLRACAEGQVGGDASGNQVVSPVSLASALGLVHAGSTSAGATELSCLLAPVTASGTAFQRELPALLKRLTIDTPELAVASRLWLDSALAKDLAPTYVAAVGQRYQASGALLNFSEPETARKAINSWAAENTGKRIQTVLPAGALTPTSKAVLTNAIHFRAAWAKQFDIASTRDKPFHVSETVVKQVPTMSQRMAVRSGVVDNATVIDMPFDEGRFSFTIAMPPRGHTLNAFEWDVSGHDMVAWARHLPNVECLVEVPKFKIEPTSVALKSWLQAQGVQTLFSDRADFSPMLGDGGKALALDNVYQSAGIALDESGAEASAATAAVMGVKSFRPQAVSICKADRPFLFAVTHVATGLPVFVGKVISP